MRKRVHVIDPVKSSLILFLFILLSASSSYAQNYPFPVDDGVWVNRYRNYVVINQNLPIYTTGWIDKYSSAGIDTVINAETYTQFNYASSSTANYHGAIRYDSGHVYFVPVDSISEYLVYDFTLQMSDTAYVLTQTDGFYPYSGSIPMYTVIPVTPESIDSIIVNGSYRKRLMLIDEYGSPFTWVDGIGNLSGLFMASFANISNYEIDLACMSEEDTVLVSFGYPNPIGSSGTCEYTIGIDPLASSSAFEVYPNPTKGPIQIDAPNNTSKLDVVVTDVLGNTLSDFVNLSGQSIKLELPEEDGVYLLHFWKKGELIGSKRVVKN